MAEDTRKILIVDDDESVLDVLSRFLKNKGYSSIISAATAQQGLEKIRLENPMVVFLDIMLPDGNGIEILQQITESHPGIGVIMITGEADDEVGRKALKLGAFEYIKKPLDFQYLERVLWWKMATMNWSEEDKTT